MNEGVGKIIKGEIPAALGKPRSFNLTDIERQAAALIAEARRRAETIVNQAQKQARQIKEQAYNQGLQKGIQEGVARGISQGRQQGEAAARAEVQKKTGGLAKLLQSIIEQFEGKKKFALAQVRHDLVGLAMTIARKVVKRELRSAEEVLKLNLEKAVELTARKTDLQIRVNPRDKQVLEEFLPQLRKRFAEMTVARVVEDDSISPGGCRIITLEGEVDADIKTQLEEIERQLLG